MEFNGKSPIYEQIYEYYKRLITLGALKYGDSLPSVREFAFSHGLNPNTVQRSFALLREDGYISSLPKKGNYVCYQGESDERKRKLLSGLSKLFEAGYSKEEIIAALPEEKSDD